MAVQEVKYPHRNMIPEITRQRCFVEASGCKSLDEPNSIFFFLELLCKELNMTPMTAPTLTRVPVLKSMGENPDDYGLSGFQIWLESGVMLHIWPHKEFIDINIETCKPFSPYSLHDVVKEYFVATEVQVTNILT